MSINKFIPVKDIIYDTFEDMGIDINHDFPTFKRWALKAESAISSFYSLKKENIVSVVNECTICLPDRVRIIRAAVLGDCGCDCGDLIDNMSRLPNPSNSNGITSFGIGQVFLSIDMPENGIPPLSVIRYHVVDNKVIFNQNLNGQTVTIQVRSMQEDCNGELMVSENHEEAIGFYLEWRYGRRSQYSPNKIERSVVNETKINWFMARDGARADDAKLTPSDRADIVEMLHDPYIGWGLQVGMNNPNDDNYGRAIY